MSHPDPEDLALLALFTSDGGAAEGADESIARHVADCARCRLEVAALTRTAALARFEDLAELPPPPNRVWAAIAAELDLDQAPPQGRSADQRSTQGIRSVPSPSMESAAAAAGRSAWPAAAGSGPPAASRAASPPAQPHLASTSPKPGATRPWFRRFGPSVAAALVAAVVGGAIGWGLRGSGSPATPAPPVAASATLVPVPGGPAKDPEKGQAQLLQTPGGPQLRVVSSDLPGIAGSYEVWLLGADGRMVSLGVLTQGAGTFTVPAGISTSQYGTVDVSDEPADGNPAHSKVSVLRGKLG